MGAIVNHTKILGALLGGQFVHGLPDVINPGITDIALTQDGNLITLASNEVTAYDQHLNKIGSKKDTDGILSMSSNQNTSKIVYGTKTYFNVLTVDGTSDWYKIHASGSKGILVSTIGNQAFSINQAPSSGTSVMVAKADTKTSGSLTSFGSFTKLLSSNDEPVKTFISFALGNVLFAQATAENRIAVIGTNGTLLDSQKLDVDGNITVACASDSRIYLATDTNSIYALTFNSVSSQVSTRYEITASFKMSSTITQLIFGGKRVYVGDGAGDLWSLGTDFDDLKLEVTTGASIGGAVFDSTNLQIITVSDNGVIRRVKVGEGN
ncbi:hypothetical protein GPK34_02145 [Secundilactobacillus kimchicus]|uniref:hypothetical protein n=1 Tax=Secundilactobacillus kimchicus TaxID=528209 RepID=UPI001C00A86F|nr:hypothetical protein [Secundilactobacillus kimchicus]MBT9670839.1 hypothetical protein [Secundilactobacillus kimchicus]